ncbi:MAG: acetoacetyl-CoA reductase [Gammaproteobacteria bacterium]
MKGKIALVTGGMGGIGTSICQYLAKENALVIATYHHRENRDAALAWQTAQKNLGYDIQTCHVDVCDFSSCTDMVVSLEKIYGRIDILVNNAGITRDIPFHKMEVSQWNDVLRTNLDSVFNVTRNVINGMIKNNYGRIINISSINAQKGQYGQTNYTAAKAGMHGFTKSIAQEVAKNGITVNTISPGYIETNMVMSLSTSILNKIIEQIPVKRLGQPEEIARAVTFLAAEKSSFITGSNLVINGGQYLL